MIGYKAKRYLVYFCLTLIGVGALYFLILGMLARSNSADLFSDVLVYFFLGLVYLSLFVFFFFAYLRLPRILIEVERDVIIVHESWRRASMIPFADIVNVGLVPALTLIPGRRSTLVITTKSHGTKSINYLVNPQMIAKYIRSEHALYFASYDGDK